MILSEQLKGSDPDLLKAATQHPFLEDAGKGIIAPDRLAAWLVQDEHYQHAYIPFIGQLLAKLRDDHSLPSTIFVASPGGTGKVENTSLQHRIVDALLGAIQALRAEESFFATTIRDYGLKDYAKPAGPNASTQEYLDLFAEVGESGSLLQGLTLLWTTEFAYYKAWKFAGSFSSSQSDGSSDATPVAAVTAKFIPNWTNKEFSGFVMQLESLVNELARQHSSSDGWEAFLKDKLVDQVWRRALECERGFWPNV